MITAATLPIKIPRRSSFDFIVEFQSAPGVAMSLVGKTIISQLWDRSRTEKYADFTVTIIGNAANGVVKFSLEADVTALLPNTGMYDVKVMENGKEYYYLEGGFTTKEGYTDD